MRGPEVVKDERSLYWFEHFANFGRVDSIRRRAFTNRSENEYADAVKWYVLRTFRTRKREDDEVDVAESRLKTAVGDLERDRASAEQSSAGMTTTNRYHACARSIVTSFGTEGRRTNGPQIPPSHELYDSITFQGPDIKDLEMLVAQPQEEVYPDVYPDVYQDVYPQYMQPQYVEPQYGYMQQPQQYMGYQAPLGYGVPPQYTTPTPAWQRPQQPPPIPQQPPAPATPPVQWQQQQQQQKQQQQSAPVPAAAPPKKPAWGNPNPPTATEGVILPAARNAPPAVGVAKVASTVPIAPKPVQAAPKPKPTSFAAAALNALAPEEVAKIKSQPKLVAPAQPQPQQRGVPAPRAGGPPSGPMVNRGGRGGAPAPAPEVPREEFNFEKMLQRFNKEKMMQTAEAKKTINAVQSQPVYNKDDFFDTMSSEATEKAEGNRNRFADQRRQDQETFGFQAVTQSQAASRMAVTAGRGGRDGGRDGGRGGRDGYRGGQDGGRGSRGGRGGRRSN